MVDVGASIIARLKTKGREEGLQLQLLLNLFCQEEILRRISKSKYCENLILKGGLLLYTLSEFASRPTIDADYLLKNHSNDRAAIEKMIHEITYIPSDNDYIQFEVSGIEVIAEHRETME
ncbi:MAG: nucleotidyl transferase AbiEii/AbiGii toxin family protein [Paenibacillaceae bacterium]